MTVLNRSELQASPLADLHLIADQLGLEGFRRLRKAELIDSILATRGAADGEDGEGDAPTDSGAGERRGSTTRRRRSTRARRNADSDSDSGLEAQADEPAESSKGASERRGGGRAREDRDTGETPTRAEGVVELSGNGSAFLRVEPPEPSERDVYISAAQVRRCELVDGDRVSGPVRPPRRSERHLSLVRIDIINGESADAVSDGARYDELSASYPSERLSFDSEDATLTAIEWLTPIGYGSRVVIAGGARAGKTETLRGILAALTGREGVELKLALAGVRPEEIHDWQQGAVAPACALTLAASADVQSQAMESVIESAKRVATRGGKAVVLIDKLDGVHPHVARKALAAARNLTDAGSLTVIATASEPLGGETTVISLDPLRASTGQPTALDLVSSGTVKPELLVGEEGAEAIMRARAGSLE